MSQIAETHQTYREIAPLRADLEEPQPPDLVEARVLELAVVRCSEALSGAPVSQLSRPKKMSSLCAGTHFLDCAARAPAHEVLFQLSQHST